MKTNFRSLITTAAFGAVLLALPARAQLAADEPSDWPLVFTSNNDQVQVFKPQPETFDGATFTARAAVALKRPTDTEPVFGAIWGNGNLEVDRDNRMGKLTTFKVTDARFPGITDLDELAGIKDMLSSEIPAHAAPIAIDWLVAALEEEKQSTTSYDNTPPSIIYRDKPSILLFIDGAPIYEAVKDMPTDSDPVYAKAATEVDRVANSPYLLVRPKGGDHWLYGSGLWYSSRNVNGPWTYEKKAPSDLEALALRIDTTPPATPGDVIPEVVVSTTPAVLVDVDGSPNMEPFKNTSLMYVTNTDDDLFLEIPTQEYYLLASGRWYATKNLKDGPWRFVASDALPADFAQVPEGSRKDGILAHVSGTDAAREAVRDASIPQTARVDRRTAAVTVNYDGDPQFQQIAGTQVYSAVNASTTVLRINGHYHVCDNAVWYEGDTPDGPWEVSTYVPAEVNNIPPSDPNYRVRYVYIYDSTPDVVFTGYTPGYVGSYVQYGTVIYGTGYYYNPWPNRWYPRPFTYGFNMYYNPWNGWGFGPTWGYTWFYPRWNYYGYYGYHPWSWWGPYSYCPHNEWHNNGYYYGHRASVAERNASRANTGDLRAPSRSNNLYDAHRNTGVRPTEMGRTALVSKDAGRTTTAPTTGRTAKPGNTAMKPIAGDHFTDRDGNVYRENAGSTEELENGRWKPVAKTPTPETTRDRQPGNTVPVTRVPARTPAGENTSPARVPQQTDRSPVTRPSQPVPEQPQEITRDRQRGEQRVDDFRGYRQQPSTPQTRPSQPARAPQTRPSPSSRPSAPTTRPSPAPRPSPSAPPSNSPRTPRR
ncbi:MAG: hypothetical protein KBF49_07505 [Flavobacteriales bacterium]|jgi:hypothetical protein|nr:hypothetical protein [Flavobacteriales bacterium]